MFKSIQEWANDNPYVLVGIVLVRAYAFIGYRLSTNVS
ncbi:MAG: hypothetical protein ACI9Y1_001193 [Lentisphaeria bacterium]|jgi:hypothetical protein